MAGVTGYNLRMYGRMVTSEPRMSAYAKALKQAIIPGCTVFDIGAGPGVFSLLACKFGAGKVVAIEPDDSVELLRSFAAANGCLDRIETFNGLSTDFSPDQRADVIISDLRGTLPLFEHHIPAIIDARERLLAPGGVLIPGRDRIFAAIAQNSKAYSEYCEEPWLHNRFGLDLTAGQRFVVNHFAQVEQKDTELLSEAATVAELDYQSINDPDVSASLELQVNAVGAAHGIYMWFESELVPGIGFSTALDHPRLVYGRAFLPLEQAQEVRPGDWFGVDLMARLMGDEYVWTWNSSLWRKGARSPEQRFRQSTFLSKVMSPASLRVRASNFVPAGTVEQEIDRTALALIDGQRTHGEIAELIRDQFPDQFENIVDALNHVTRLTSRYR